MTGPRFSVVMTTRDRVSLFAEALSSVLAQKDAEFDVCVAVDGGNEADSAAYDRIFEAAGGRLRVTRLPQRERGHGTGFAMNAAAAIATGDYLAFLDDDDLWTDGSYLARAGRIIGAGRPDALFFNQTAYRDGEPTDDARWMAGLEPVLRAAGREPSDDGAFAVDAEDCVKAGGFCHVNALVVRRSLWERLGGKDETIPWEGDRDLFLRLIETAGRMAFVPVVVARHNVPDPSKKANATTRTPMLARRLSQLRVLDKALSRDGHPAVRAYAARHKGWTLKKIALELKDAGRPRAAAAYAREALGLQPGIKWALMTARLSAAALGAK